VDLQGHPCNVPGKRWEPFDVFWILVGPWHGNGSSEEKRAVRPKDKVLDCTELAFSPREVFVHNDNELQFDNEERFPREILSLV